MKKSLFINECRIPLDEIHKLKALKYPSKGLSSKHKKYVQRCILKELERIAIFDGDILFCLIDQQADTRDEKELLRSFLKKQIRLFNEKLLQPITLLQLPESTVERLVFALVAAQARVQGIYKLRGRSFFKPSKSNKKGHLAVDTTLITEDSWIKLYFVPTLTLLTEITNTNRSEIKDVPAIGLCSFRNQCDIAEPDGSCQYFTPGYLGLVEDDKGIEVLSNEAKEALVNNFKNCPQIKGAQRVVDVKPTKRARNTVWYPAYAVKLHFVDADFSGRQKDEFRKFTLMSSDTRWTKTHEWIEQILGLDNRSSKEFRSVIEQGGVQLPVTSLLEQEHAIGGRENRPYKPVDFPDQKIIIDQQNPQPSAYGGGYEFNRSGAYDRHSLNRPFDTISPFIILPNIPNTATQTRSLMKSLSDGYRKKETAYYDRNFEGLNTREGLQKYNTRFVNPWDEEEFTLLNDTSDQSYSNAVDDYIRRWNASRERDPGKIVIVVKPPETSSTNSPSLYYNLKSKLNGEGIPNQFLTFETLAKLTSRQDAFGPVLESIWLNIYAKMGGIPWRIESEIGNVHCFIGVGFGLNTSKIGEHIYAGVAHVFDKYGNWIDVASDSQQVDTDEYDSFLDRNKFMQGTASFKISQETTESIVYNALRLYKDKQDFSHLPPQNIVLHKLGQIYDCEVTGFLEAIKRVIGNIDMCRLGILQIEQDHLRRLYGSEAQDEKLNRTVFRGTGLVINDKKLLLASTGRTRSKYFGIGTPNPLLLTSVMPSVETQRAYGCRAKQFYGIETLGQHVMALTQLHWGSTRDNVRQPITTLYAQKVAELISKMERGIDTWTSYHRPWFL